MGRILSRRSVSARHSIMHTHSHSSTYRVLLAENVVGEPPGVGVAERVRVGRHPPVPHLALPVGGDRSLLFNGTEDGLAERHEAGPTAPLGLDLGPVRAGGRLGAGLVEAGQSGDGHAQNEGMVARVNVVVQQGRRLGVGPGHQNQVAPQNVGRQSGRHQTVNVLLGAHQNLAAHVPALFGPRLLVFEVHPRRPRFDHELGQLHDRRQSAVARVTVGNDRLQIVQHWTGILAVQQRLGAGLLLPAVVVQLRSHQMVDLVGDRVARIVGHVGSWLVGGGRGRAALPPAHVNGRQVRSHLRHLDGIERPERVRVPALAVQRRQQLPELVRHLRAEAGRRRRELPAPCFGARSEARHVHGWTLDTKVTQKKISRRKE
jgi:hypothetical protein